MNRALDHRPQVPAQCDRRAVLTSWQQKPATYRADNTMKDPPGIELRLRLNDDQQLIGLLAAVVRDELVLDVGLLPVPPEQLKLELANETETRDTGTG